MRQDELTDIVYNNPEILEHLNRSCRNDKDITLTAIAGYSGAFAFVDWRLQGSKDYVLEAVRVNPSALKYVHIAFQDDDEVVAQAMAINPDAILYASTRLQRQYAKGY